MADISHKTNPKLMPMKKGTDAYTVHEPGAPQNPGMNDSNDAGEFKSNNPSPGKKGGEASHE